MPTGLIPAAGPIVATPAVRGAGEMEWASMTGVDAESPLVGGPHIEGLGIRDVDRGMTRIVSLPGANDPASGKGVTGPGVELLDDWRDLFNFRGSPMPWLLLLTLAMLGMAQLAVSARVGPVRAAGGVG